jgi:hypothetical protein
MSELLQDRIEIDHLRGERGSTWRNSRRSWLSRLPKFSMSTMKRAP